MERPHSIEYPESSGPPQLTTFYSFKGGVGRTQSLYNVGVRLAALRRKVLMVDVDLEAPGLSIGALDEQERSSKDGFAEIASDLLLDLEVALDEKDPNLFAEVVNDYQRRINRALHVLDVPMPPRQENLAERLREEMGVTDLPTGSLTLLSSGRINPDYPRKMIDVRIDEAFQKDLSEEQQDRLPELLDQAGLKLPGVPDNLGLVFTAVLRFLLRNATDPNTDDRFRHVLIDSRSGLADVGGLCLRGLPDTRVVLSGLNTQNVEGTRMVLNTLSREERYEDELIVVFSPVPEGEVDLLEERIHSAKKTLTFRDKHGTDQISEEQIRLLHYHPRIALEEKPFTQSSHERTRIYDEYEELTDRILALTDSDADALVDRALDRFQNEDVGDEHPYRRLAQDLLPASFVDAERVDSVVDGFCSQLNRREHSEPNALPLFDLWVTLSSDEPRVLGTTANYYSTVGRGKGASDLKETEELFQRSFGLNERITETSPDEERAWHNWGNDLARLAQLVQREDPEQARSLYYKAFDKYQKAVDINSDLYQAWFNWGTHLGNLAQLVAPVDPDRARSLYHKAFDKYQKAVDVNPDKDEAWSTWGINLVRLGRLLRSRNETQKAHHAFSDAVEKLRESLSHGSGGGSLFWLIVALAERNENGDIDTAADHLNSLLEETPGFVYEFYDEDAEAVRSHPELREILDEYREKIDEDELEEAENPNEVDAPDLSE